MFSKFDTNPQSDELTTADLYDAQGEWESEQYEGEPVMELPNDLFMVFDDPDSVSYTHLTQPTICSV